MATKPVDAPSKPATSTKRPPGVPAKGGSTQEAKDLRTLINTLSEKNAPDSSKEITAYAKQTLKIVAQSQKAESAAFRREATKALFDFRTFVEKSEKVTESRRSKLLSDIDSVSLDAKSATLMMMSIAKEQSKTIKMTAQKEALVEKMKAKQNALLLVDEARQKAKAIGDEVKLKSKALSEEQANKFKAMKEEMVLKHKANAEQSKLKLSEEKDKIKAERIGLHAKYDKIRLELADEKAKLKLENEAEKDKIKQSRVESASKLKELKAELKSRQEAKNDKQDADNKSRKEELKTKTAERIQKIRLMTEEHKAKLKKAEEENKAENVIKKAKLKGEIREIEEKHKARQDKAKKNADDLTGKVKDGIYDANPMIHAAVQIVSGVVGMIQKRNGDKKKQKDLNRLQHRNTNTPNPTPNPRPANTPTPPPGNQNQESDGGGGIFGNIMAMIPSIGSMVTGLVSFFKTIGSAGGKLSKLLVGTKAIPIIGTAIAVVMTIFDFLEGFNNASKLFGEKVEDDNYIKRIFSGFVNVFASIIGIFDTVAGWMGFDTDLKGMYERAQVKLYNKITDVIKIITDSVGGIFDSILSVIRTMAGNIGAILQYVPGAGAAAKVLKAYSDAGKSTAVPVSPTGTAAAISSKQSQVDDLQDQVDAKKAKGGSVQIAADNSIKTNTTNVSTAPLSTRNNDRNAPGYLVTR